LRWAWRESRDSKSDPGAPGVDGVRAERFASELADEIRRIREDVRTGTYRFKKLRLARMKKSSGQYRILAIPTVRDRLLQRALLWHLENDVRFNAASPIAYGFIKERTLPCAQRRALELRQSHPWVLKCDIVQFFDRIPRPALKDLIGRQVRSKVVQTLLCQAVDCELEESDAGDAQFVRDCGIIKGTGLRQGMPVSPLLSNLLLKDFDRKLQAERIRAVRYADDIAVFADSARECDEALSCIQTGLADLKLRVPGLDEAGKTARLRPSQPAEFLGVEIRRFEAGYELCAPSGRLREIEADMAEIVSIEQCIKTRRNLGEVARRLESFVIGHAASMAVLANPQDFRNRLDAAKNRQMTALLVNLLGQEVVDRLAPEGRAILGIEPFPSIPRKRQRSTGTAQSSIA